MKAEPKQTPDSYTNAKIILISAHKKSVTVCSDPCFLPWKKVPKLAVFGTVFLKK